MTMEAKYIFFVVLYALAMAYWIDLIRGFRHLDKTDKWYMYTPFWFLMSEKLKLDRWFCIRGAAFHFVLFGWILYALAP